MLCGCCCCFSVFSPWKYFYFPLFVVYVGCVFRFVLCVFLHRIFCTECRAPYPTAYFILQSVIFLFASTAQTNQHGEKKNQKRWPNWKCAIANTSFATQMDICIRNIWGNSNSHREKEQERERERCGGRTEWAITTQHNTPPSHPPKKVCTFHMLVHELTRREQERETSCGYLTLLKNLD